jgi:hypothetical protein
MQQNGLQAVSNYPETLLGNINSKTSLECGLQGDGNNLNI